MTNNSGGVGLPSLLTIVFVVLKLTGTITWSWWLVFSPLLFAAAVAVIVLLFVVVLAALTDR